MLSSALTRSGFAASVHEVGVGKQLCQHHCPVSHVATKYPQLCEEEMAVFTRELGTYAQRLATIARGDAVCTTFIPISTIPPVRSVTGGRTDQRDSDPDSSTRPNRSDPLEGPCS